MNWIQTETKRLTTTYEKVMIEDLNIQGMMKGFCSAKNYVDVSWRTFVFELEQKGKKHSCKIVKADRFFPSSKLCHCCGYKKEDLTLLDDYDTPKLKDYYSLFDEIIFFPTFKKTKIIECRPITFQKSKTS